MKKVLTILVAILFVLCATVYAEGYGVRIDADALNWYAQATTASFQMDNLPLSVVTKKLDSDWVMMAYLAVGEERPATIEEALTADRLPCNAVMLYDSYDNSVIFLFNRSVVEEIPQSVTVYADDQVLKGDLYVRPEDVNEETSSVGFGFSLEEIHEVLFADEAFMRLVTDRGICFIEMNSEKMLTHFYMMGMLYRGARYSTISDGCYLDKSILDPEIRDWQPETTTTAAPTVNSQTKPFQADYEAIDKAAQSVFLLEVYDSADKLIATGSGFVAFDKTALITNEHVIEGAAYVIAYSDQYREEHKLTELLAVDAELDIAILKFDGAANVQPLAVDCNAKILRGQPVTAIGSPQGILNTVSSGNVSNIVYFNDRISDGIQFTAPISAGSSGGALFDERGHVIGLCESRSIEGDAIYYAIPVKYVEKLYNESRRQQPVTLLVYNGLDRIHIDPLSGVAFTIMDGWYGKVLEQDEKRYVYGLSQESEDAQTIIFVCTDLLTEVDKATRRKIEANLMKRSALDEQYFTRAVVSRREGVPDNVLILETYAGRKYYGYKYVGEDMQGWVIVGVKNGYMYEIVIAGSEIPTNELRATLKTFMSTFQFP